MRWFNSRLSKFMVRMNLLIGRRHQGGKKRYDWPNLIYERVMILDNKGSDYCLYSCD